MPHVEIICFPRDAIHVGGIGAEELGVDLVSELCGQSKE